MPLWQNSICCVGSTPTSFARDSKRSLFFGVYIDGKVSIMVHLADKIQKNERFWHILLYMSIFFCIFAADFMCIYESDTKYI